MVLSFNKLKIRSHLQTHCSVRYIHSKKKKRKGRRRKGRRDRKRGDREMHTQRTRDRESLSEILQSDAQKIRLFLSVSVV